MTAQPPIPTFRFAPSPNGALHLGHAYSALLNQRLAAEAGGRLLLRIEDLDRTRCKREYEQAIRDYDQALRLGPDAESYYSRGWAYYQQGAYVSAFRDFVEASRRKPALLGRWIWTPLLPAAWLIYFVLRSRRAKQSASVGAAAGR